MVFSNLIVLCVEFFLLCEINWRDLVEMVGWIIEGEMCSWAGSKVSGWSDGERRAGCITMSAGFGGIGRQLGGRGWRDGG